ncbi:MAG: ADP-ribosylglycohydrolase family protein [Planctomycetia bacterium]|nr:ADP-ribosylglycohydrolase family protein [Planctomycetia bacterium]
MSRNILAGIVGLAVGNALGVPVNNWTREELFKSSVVDMRASTSDTSIPAGSWSEPTSLTLASADSLSFGLNYEDMMRRLWQWYKGADYTPFDYVQKVSEPNQKAIIEVSRGTPALECGLKSAKYADSGSVLRMIPLFYYLTAEFGHDFIEIEEARGIIHNCSSLTHAQPVCQLGCAIYLAIMAKVSVGMSISIGVRNELNHVLKIYSEYPEFSDALKQYGFLFDQNFQFFSPLRFRGTSFVVDTLEKVIWCFINTNTFEECVLQTVNMGNNTETAGALAGGLGGVFYGFKNIPQKWKDDLVQYHELIVPTADKLFYKLVQISMEKIKNYLPYFKKATSERVFREEFDTESNMKKIKYEFQSILNGIQPFLFGLEQLQ